MAALIVYLAGAVLVGLVVGVEARYNRPLTAVEEAELAELAALNVPAPRLFDGVW